METSPKRNMDNLEKHTDDYCRACLNDCAVKRHAIFPKLAEKLLDCTNISASENDEFSNFLCDYCYNKLIEFHMFQAMFKASLEKFREALRRCAEKKSESKLLLEYTAFSNENTLNCVETEIQISNKKPEIFLKRNSNKIRKSNRIQNKNIISVCENSTLKPPHEKDGNTFGRIEHSIEGSLNSIKRSQQLNHRTGKLYLCEICPMRFFVEHRLTAHKRSHDGLMPYPCPKENCQRGFKRWNCLNEHLKQHEGTKKWFSCEEEGCDRRYQHRTTLDMHMRRYHKKGPELKSFICEVCGKVFKSSAILNDHRFTHKDKSELPFACDQTDCKYRFSNREKLKVHLMRHAGIKNFECPHCGMKKTTRNELKIHINYHTLERTFPCRFCSQVCNSAGNLKVHVKTVHERAKDYACRFCERTFAKPDTRKYHEMIHTGEKPHQCAECGKKFVQPAALRTHKKIHQRQKSQRDTNLELTKTNDCVNQVTNVVDVKLTLAT